MTNNNFIQRTRKQDERAIVRTQNRFDAGQYSDIDPSDIPYNSVSKLINARGYSGSLQGRTGSLQYSERELPIRDNASGSDITITGNKALITNGGEFHTSMAGDVLHGTTVEGVSVHIPITEYINVNEVILDRTEIGSLSLNSWKVVGNINAHYRDTYTGLNYYLIGNEIYSVFDDPSASFLRWTVINKDEINNGPSYFFKIKKYVALFNSGGIFILNDSLGAISKNYVWKANNPGPEYPIDKQSVIPNTNNPSAYNYLNTIIRLNGLQTDNRNSEGSFLEYETPPFKVENETNIDLDAVPDFYPWDPLDDYSQYVTSKPIDDSKYSRFKISNINYIKYETWVDLSESGLNPYILFNYNGSIKRVYFDFTAVTNMKEVAEEIQVSLGDIDVGFRCYYDFDENDNYWLDIWNVDKDIVWSIASSLDFLDGRPYNYDNEPETGVQRYVVTVLAPSSDDIGKTITDGTNLYSILSIEQTPETAYNGFRVSLKDGDNSCLIKRHNPLYIGGTVTSQFQSADFTEKVGSVSPTYGTDITSTSPIEIRLDKSIEDRVFYGSAFITTNSSSGVLMSGGLTWGSSEVFYASVTGDGNVDIRIGSDIVTDTVTEWNYADYDQISFNMYVMAVLKSSGDSIMRVRIFSKNVTKEYEVSSTVATFTNMFTHVQCLGTISNNISYLCTGDINNFTEFNREVINVSGGPDSNDVKLSSIIPADAGSLLTTESEAVLFTSSDDSIWYTSVFNDFYINRLYSESDLFGQGILNYSSGSFDMGVSVSLLRYPPRMKDGTHYSIHRTPDIFPFTTESYDPTDPRLANNINAFGWIEDVPCCGFFHGELDGDEIALSTGHTDNTLIGTRIYHTGTLTGVLTIIGVKGPDTYEVSLVGGSAQGEFQFYWGSETLLTLAIDETGVITGHTFLEEDHGKALFWLDGTIDTLIVENGAQRTLKGIYKDSQYCLIDPTNRAYYDTTTDVIRARQLPYWPLQTRDYKPLPTNSSIAAYINGNILLAQRGFKNLYWSDAEEIRNLGYYYDSEQESEALEDGVYAILPVKDLFGVFTETQTFIINPKQSIIVDGDRGNVWSRLPDPYLVDAGKGMTNQCQHVYGDQGDLFVMTNEPALRFFNERGYGKDYSNGSVNRTVISKLKKPVVMSYCDNAGVHIWGTDGKGD